MYPPPHVCVRACARARARAYVHKAPAQKGELLSGGRLGLHAGARGVGGEVPGARRLVLLAHVLGRYQPSS
jgi:hypothetical protein